MLNIGTAVNLLCNPSLFDENKNSSYTNKPVSVTFCIPGKNFSTGFFNSWTKFLFFIKDNPNLITPHFSNYYAEDTCEMKNTLLSGDINKGAYQLPFQEDFESTLIFWLDPNIVFEPLQVMQIIYKMFKHDLVILSALCCKDEKLSSAIKDDQTNYSINELISTVKNQEFKICEIENTTLGFVCFKNTLFQEISYPWFEANNEDLGLLIKLKDNGAKVYCDTSIVVRYDS